MIQTHENPTQPQHTPTPWKIQRVAQDKHFSINGKPIGQCWLVYRDDTEFVQRLGYFETLAQAELAQRAVNSYGEESHASDQKKIKALIEAAKDALCELDPDCKYDGSNYNGEPSDKGNSRIQTILALYRILDEAGE